MTSGNDAALRERLGNVYWIGGGSGAGKSTIARRTSLTGSLDPGVEWHLTSNGCGSAPLRFVQPVDHLLILLRM